MIEKALLAVLMSLVILISAKTTIFAQAVETRTVVFAGGYIDIPKNYKTKQIVGPDFIVNYVFSDVPGEEDGVLGVYSGCCPGFEPPKSAKTRIMRLGVRKVKWYSWVKREKEKITYINEALIRENKDDDSLHLFVSGRNKKDVQRLLTILNTYRKSQLPLRLS